MRMPSALASGERAITQPSLLDSTTMGVLPMRRAKHALAGGEEVVAVDQRKHDAQLTEVPIKGMQRPARHAPDAEVFPELDDAVAIGRDCRPAE